MENPVNDCQGQCTVGSKGPLTDCDDKFCVASLVGGSNMYINNLPGNKIKHCENYFKPKNVCRETKNVVTSTRKNMI